MMRQLWMALKIPFLPSIISLSKNWLSLWLMSVSLECKAVPTIPICRLWSSIYIVLRVTPSLENPLIQFLFFREINCSLFFLG